MREGLGLESRVGPRPARLGRCGPRPDRAWRWPGPCRGVAAASPGQGKMRTEENPDGLGGVGGFGLRVRPGQRLRADLLRGDRRPDCCVACACALAAPLPKPGRLNSPAGGQWRVHCPAHQHQPRLLCAVRDSCNKFTQAGLAGVGGRLVADCNGSASSAGDAVSKQLRTTMSQVTLMHCTAAAYRLQE